MQSHDDLAARIRAELEPVLDNIHADNRQATSRLTALALVFGIVAEFLVAGS